jgi:hypothetical protein
LPALSALLMLAAGGCTSAAAPTELLIQAPTSTATPTPFPPATSAGHPVPQARPLTEPGCCARHWWASDSSTVYFIDDPRGEEPVGIYGAPPAGGSVILTTTSVLGEGLPPEDAPPQLEPKPAAAFRVPADADNIRMSQDGTSVAWTTGSTLPVNVDRRQRSLWVVTAPGAPRQNLALLTGGELVGWAEDAKAVVATGRLAVDGPAGVWRVPVDGSTPSLLVQADRPRGARLSPSGKWLAYYLAFEPEAERNGLWLVETSGGSARLVPWFGSYRWSRLERLFVIPFDPTQPGLRLSRYDPSNGEVQSLAADDPFTGAIAANDWSVAPDEGWIAYRSAADGGLWIFPLESE